jgi:hypothetical protein
MISILGPPGHILVDSFNLNPNYVPLAPAGLILANLVTHDLNFCAIVTSWSGHILTDLFNHDLNFVSPGTSRSHFS